MAVSLVIKPVNSEEAHGPVETGLLKPWVMEAEDLALLLISHRVLGKLRHHPEFLFPHT